MPTAYTFEQFIENLNRRIFFWPGTDAGPINYGVRHFERYGSEHPAILKIDFQSLINSNPAVEPHYCRYNSGSPRCSHGQKSPRGPNTFQSGDQFVGTPSAVVEVTFSGPLILPANVRIGRLPSGSSTPQLSPKVERRLAYSTRFWLEWCSSYFPALSSRPEQTRTR